MGNGGNGNPAGIPARHLVILWLIAGGVAFVLCVPLQLSATLVDGAYMPGDHDSFYHGRRILDSIADPWRMYQFDPAIHAPEGSWVTWPWAYDTLMALVAKAAMALGAPQPMPVLAYVAPAWVFVNAALLLGAAAQLRLSLLARILALAFFALSPITPALHRVGMLDHHYVEYTFVLAVLYFGLAWFQDLSHRRRAIVLGIVLGAAPAFHNGLFILQLPVLGALAWRWALQRPLDRAAANAFAAALVAATAAFLAHSEPFLRGDFSYYLHSWFHLYIACCTAAYCVAASRIRATPGRAAAAIAVAAALAMPILAQVELGSKFLFGKLEYLATIPEFGSVAEFVLRGDFLALTSLYSALLWVLPATIAWLFWGLRREADDASLYFLAMTVFGTFVMLQQFRLQYFGTFALILPLCRLIDELGRSTLPAVPPRIARPVAAGLVAATMLPGLPSALQVRPPAGDFQYALTRQIYPALHRACAARPGLVLADYADGHYIRYHSDCPVIANMFILTPQHVEKVRESEELMAAASLGEVLAREPQVRYLLVRRADNIFDESRGCDADCPENRGLRRELLGREAPFPPRLRLVDEVRFKRGTQIQPLVRLFEVTP